MTIIIPARFGSTRFPGKVLAGLHGKPWIQHVYEAAVSWDKASEVWVATADQNVYDSVKRFGGRVYRTSAVHRSGSDRCAEVCRQLDSDLVINLQADELLLEAGILDEVLGPFESDPALQMTTLKREIVAPEEVVDPNVVKVVTDHLGNALYFSRSPIPYNRRNPRSGTPTLLPGKTFYKHLGIYAFRRDFLLRFPSLPPSQLEEIEGLEQMRVLEEGVRIRVVETRKETLRVDTPEDLEKIKGNWRSLEQL